MKLAEVFVQKGNKVIITGRRLEKLQQAQEQIPELEIIQGDVGTVDGVKKLAKTVLSDYPKINVLINNAGILKLRNLTQSTEDLDELTCEVGININGPIRMNAMFMDTLKKNKGTIINVSSGLGFVPNLAMPIYCATKATLRSYSIALRQQLEGAVEVIEVNSPRVITELDDNANAIKAKDGLTVDEYVPDVIEKLEAGETLITTGLSTKML